MITHKRKFLKIIYKREFLKIIHKREFLKITDKKVKTINSIYLSAQAHSKILTCTIQ
jgi:hypothetical protein